MNRPDSTCAHCRAGKSLFICHALVVVVMAQRIAPDAYAALSDALSVICWRKQHLQRFLRAVLVGAPELLAGIDWTGQPGRASVGRLVGRLIASEHRLRTVTVGLMGTAAGFDDFSHLLREEDGPAKAAEACAAVAGLRRHTARHAELIAEREAASRRRAMAAAAAATHRELAAHLSGLRERLWALEGEQDRRRGLLPERFLFDLFCLFDLGPRGPFVLRGERIDGAFSFDTDDYLLQARWRREQAASAGLAVFERKVSTKTHKTSGLYVSMHGFSQVAVDKFAGVGAGLLLAVGSDLVIVEGRAAVRRSTREFSVTGRSVRHRTGLNLLGQGANGQQARCSRRLVVLEPGQMSAAQADRYRVGRCRSGLGGGWPGRPGGCNTMGGLDAFCVLGWLVPSPAGPASTPASSDTSGD